MITTVGQVILAEEGIELIELANAHGSIHQVYVPVSSSMDQRANEITKASQLLQQLEDSVEARAKQSGSAIRKKLIVPAAAGAPPQA